MFQLLFSLILSQIPVLKSSFLLLHPASRRIRILSSTILSLYILFFYFWFWMNANLEYQVHKDIIDTEPIAKNLLLSAHVFLSCFYPWPYVLNNQTFSSNSVNIFSSGVHLFCNLFLKKKQKNSLFGQILTTCLKCSRASFLTSSYSKKMCLGHGCRSNTFWKKLIICLFFKSLPPDYLP